MNIKVALACIVAAFVIGGVLVYSSEEISISKGITIERVIDGDTFIAKVDGAVLSVRLIGIDAPELGTCHAEKSKQILKSLLLNQEDLWLTKGSEEHDKYGRTLAYVFDKDVRFINMHMVKLGAAKAMNISPNIEHAHLFNEAEAQASIANVGSNRSC